MRFWGNKPQPLSPSDTGGVTSVVSWLFSALRSWGGAHGSRESTPGMLSGPLGNSWKAVQQRRGFIRVSLHIALLKAAMVHGRGPCPCPQLGWAKAAKFLWTDADVSFSATPLWRGAGCLMGLAEDRPSPQLSSRPPVPAMALSSTGGPGGCRSLGLEPAPLWWQAALCWALAVSGSTCHAPASPTEPDPAEQGAG